jgi:hypothetical protein
MREGWRVTAEVAGLKTRGRLLTLVRFAGLLLVLIGGYNMLLAPLVASPPLLADVYVPLLVEHVGAGVGLLSHITIITIGAVVVWFV